MKKYLNTLYINSQGAYVSHEGEAILVRIGEEEKHRIPIHLIDGLVCFGNVAITSPLLGLCGQRGVTVSLLTETGRFLARVQGGVAGNVLLRRAQYRIADDPKRRLEMARAFVLGKIANSRTVMQRAARDHAEKGIEDSLARPVGLLGAHLQSVRQAADLEVIRGLEGEAARIYFKVFHRMVTAQEMDFQMKGRSRRPPLDNINALLSFVYTMMVHDAESALESVGLDPQVGFLHAERPGRPSLALDLIEEFRPSIGDRLVLSLINLRQVQGRGFNLTESGGIVMDEATRKAVVRAYQARKQENIAHPFLEETAPVGLLFHLQALLMARHLRGDLDAYPPFFWR